MGKIKNFLLWLFIGPTCRHCKERYLEDYFGMPGVPPRMHLCWQKILWIEEESDRLAIAMMVNSTRNFLDEWRRQEKQKLKEGE